jgi:DNA-binding NarL/FixJ family response regulator
MGSKQPDSLIRSSDRLHDLLSTFWTLRSSNHILVDQLRGSMGQLRELRRKLNEWPRYSPDSGTQPEQSDEKLMKSFGLTRREAQVARLLSRGHSNQAIARELEISEHTARHHTQRILAKLEVHSRGEAGAKIRG